MVDFAKLNKLEHAKTAGKRRVLICGGREWQNYERILTCIKKAHNTEPIDIVIEGECRGADVLGRVAADYYDIPVWRFPAQWEKYKRGKGNPAGPIRNQQMLDEGRPTEVWAFHNSIEHSSGTADMVKRSGQAGLKIWVITETSWKCLLPEVRQQSF